MAPSPQRTSPTRRPRRRIRRSGSQSMISGPSSMPKSCAQAISRHHRRRMSQHALVQQTRQRDTISDEDNFVYDNFKDRQNASRGNIFHLLGNAASIRVLCASDSINKFTFRSQAEHPDGVGSSRLEERACQDRIADSQTQGIRWPTSPNCRRLSLDDPISQLWLAFEQREILRKDNDVQVGLANELEPGICHQSCHEGTIPCPNFTGADSDGCGNQSHSRLLFPAVMTQSSGRQLHSDSFDAVLGQRHVIKQQIGKEDGQLPSIEGFTTYQPHDWGLKVQQTAHHAAKIHDHRVYHIDDDYQRNFADWVDVESFMGLEPFTCLGRDSKGKKDIACQGTALSDSGPLCADDWYDITWSHNDESV